MTFEFCCVLHESAESLLALNALLIVLLGMWAHTMTVEDYQDLIDRGWRR